LLPPLLNCTIQQSSWVKPSANDDPSTPVTWYGSYQCTEKISNIHREAVNQQWQRVYLQDGNIYYYNKETKESSWELPSILIATTEESFSNPSQPKLDAQAALLSVKRKLGETNSSHITPNPPHSNKRGRSDLDQGEPSADQTNATPAIAESKAAALDDNEQAVALFTVSSSPFGFLHFSPRLQHCLLTCRQRRCCVKGSSRLFHHGKKNFLSYALTLDSKVYLVPSVPCIYRYPALPKHSDRRAVFEGFVKSLMKQERNSKLEKTKVRPKIRKYS